MINRRIFLTKKLGQQRIAGLTTFLCSSLAIGCLLVQVVVSNRFAWAGKNIDSTDVKIRLLTDENTSLREEIASASAFIAVKNHAEKLGFVQAIVPTFLKLDQPVAVNP